MSLLNVSFYAPSLRRTVPLTVLMPTDKVLPGTKDYHAAPPCKTIYLLNGVFGSCQDWLCYTRVRALAQTAGLCVVMPSGDNKFYCDSPISGDLYGRFITHDLVQFVENTFHVSPRREDRIIAGLSMGGYGAVANGLRAPEVFGAIAGMSTAFLREEIRQVTENTGYGLFTPTQFATMLGLADLADFDGSPCDCDHLIRQAAKGGVVPRIYLCCGESDMLLPCNHAFRDLALSLGCDLTWEQWPGDHNWVFWDKAIEKVIGWLALGEGSEGISSGNVTE